MGPILKTVFVAAVAGLVAGCIAGVVVAAFGWPLMVAGVLAGVGAGAAAVPAYKRLKAAERRRDPSAAAQ